MAPPGALLIIGAGYLGLTIARLAQNSEQRVIAARRGQPNLESDNLIQWLQMDVSDPKSVQVNIEKLSKENKISGVIYCVSAGTPSQDAYRNAYYLGLKNILESIDPQIRFLFVSSTGVFPQDQGEWVDESSSTSGDGHSSLQKQLVLGEGLVQARPNSVIARFSGIYGPGRTRLITMAQSLPDLMIISQMSYTNRIHVEDGARAILHILQMNAPASLYCITDNDPAPQHEILLWLRQQIGLEAPQVSFRSETGTETNPADLPVGNKRIRNNRLVATGFDFIFPTFREGYKALC